MNTRRSIALTLLFAVMMLMPFAASAAFQNETLRYVISYKWGLVHKDAGDATLTLRNSGGNYNIILTAKTKPWADKIFTVRDTLRSVVKIAGLKPLTYTKTTHEGGKYARDVIKYSYAGRNVVANCDRIKEKKGKITKSHKRLSSSGPSYDMLSIFYYLRSINFEKMKKNTIYKATVFSGKQVETIAMRNMGVETIKLRDTRQVKAYHIRFNFTSNGKKKSSADMHTWISTDSRHIPLLLEGDLPVGKIKCYYIGG